MEPTVLTGQDAGNSQTAAVIIQTDDGVTGTCMDLTSNSTQHVAYIHQNTYIPRTYAVLTLEHDDTTTSGDTLEQGDTTTTEHTHTQ